MTVRIAVVRSGGGWKVISDDLSDGRSFAFRVDAEEAALRRCRDVEARGDSVEVLVQHANGELRPLLVVPPDQTRH